MQAIARIAEQRIVQAIKEGAQGKIVDVEDLEDGERVEVYVE